MNELVIMKDKQAVTTSLQIAESFGKEHKHVLAAIDDIRGVGHWVGHICD